MSNSPGSLTRPYLETISHSLLLEHSTLLGPHPSFRCVSVPDISGIHSTYINEAILRRLASGGTRELSAVPILTPANSCQLY